MNKIDTEIYYDVKEWLTNWNAHNIVFTVSMGGLSESYEIAIQSIAAYMMQWIIDNPFKETNTISEATRWKEYINLLDKEVGVLDQIDDIGPTGAMWSAARNLALNFTRRGPYEAMKDSAVKDRIITIKKP